MAVQVLASPAGQGEGAFQPPWSAGEWPRIRASLERALRYPGGQEESSAPVDPREAGEALFRALFSGQVGTLWARSLGAVADRGLRIQIRLRLEASGSSVLDSFPWELLYQPDTRDFLALSRVTPIVRFLEVPRPVSPLRLPAVLRILAVIAEAPELGPLDLERERQEIEAAWGDGPGVEIVFLREARLEALRRALLEGEIHVLHFMGHGALDRSTGQGVLFFERDGGPDQVPGESLATLLKDVKSLRLVFLNACETAQTPDGDGRDPFAGVASALVMGGVPAVIAMQLPISDPAAIVFSRTVYLRLADGDPVDAAVTEGRLAIYTTTQGTMEWAIPVLFTRVADGRIFQRRSFRPQDTVTRPLNTVVRPLVPNAPSSGILGRFFQRWSSGPQGTGTRPPIPPLGTPPATLTPETRRSMVGRLPGATSDKGATEDHLDFISYIEAFADLTESPYTQLPLTVGVFGSWGMGKSFLLDGLNRSISERQQERQESSRRRRFRLFQALRKTNTAQKESELAARVHVVTFNAWEYSASEAIWPGLVRKIMDRLEKEVSWPFPGRFPRKLWRNLKGLAKKERVRAFVVAYLVIGLVALAVFYLWPQKFSEIWKTLLAAGVAGFVAGLLKLVGDTWANPLSQWFTNLFLEDDYGRHIGHLARIRKDLEFLEGRLHAAEKRVERVLILIDDLDRCEPNKAVEMLQTINLLLDFRSFIIFLGIDARIITSAIEKHYQGLLGEAGASGYEYLDKIIQIPFRIPVPLRSQVETYLGYLMGNPEPQTLPAAGEAKPSTLRRDALAPEPKPIEKRTTERGGTRELKPRREALSAAATAGLSNFTFEELQAFKNLASGLKPNPRHLKRLVNVYRLVRSLADAHGEETLLAKPGATICWVVLCAQWPYTTQRMLRCFEGLERTAESDKDFKLPEEEPLRHLLKAAETDINIEGQQKLDQDPVLLRKLIAECEEARMTWAELRIIRRYTINFNPAIEVETVADLPPSQG